MNWMRIPLTQGKSAIVDLADFEYLSRWKWSTLQGHYAHRNTGDGWVRMHRLIMGEPEGMVDHRDGDGFNNRRTNLRTCTAQQNSANKRISRNNTTGYKNIYWDTARKRWAVQIMNNGRKHSIGRYTNLEEAISARDEAVLNLNGEFARTESTHG